MRKKWMLFAGAAVLAAALLSGCQKQSEAAAPAASETAAAPEQASAAESDAEETTAEASEAASAEDSEWTREGAFADPDDNYLLLFHMSKEEGDDEDGWSTTLMTGTDWYGGILQDEDGVLSGKVMIYGDDGEPEKELAITIREDGDNVLAETGDGKSYVFTPQEGGEEASGDFLPMFYYNAVLAPIHFDPIEAAAYDYLTFDMEYDSDFDNVVIPYAQVVAVEDKEDESLIYGDYWIWEFAKQEDTLVDVSGGHFPGVIHADRFGDGEAASYTAVSMDTAFSDDEIDGLFGQYADAYTAVSSDDVTRDEGLAQNIADYVNQYQLDITKYQIGEETKELPEPREPEFPAESLPMYVNPEWDSTQGLVEDALVNYYSGVLAGDDETVTLPFIRILSEEDGDREVTVLTDGWVADFCLEGDVLVRTSSTRASGKVTLHYGDDDYVRQTEYQEVEDGSNYNKSAKEIFGDLYDEMMSLTYDDYADIRLQVIRAYVSEYDLDVNAYQDGDELTPIN